MVQWHEGPKIVRWQFLFLIYLGYYWVLTKMYLSWDCSRRGRCLSPYLIHPSDFICSCNGEFPAQLQLSPFSCLFWWAFSGTLPKGSMAQKCERVNVLWVGVDECIPCFLVLQKDNSEAGSTLFFRGFLVRLSFSCLQRSSTHRHTFIGSSSFSGSLSSLPHLCFLGSLPRQTILGQEPRLRQELRPLNYKSLMLWRRKSKFCQWVIRFLEPGYFLCKRNSTICWSLAQSIYSTL